MFPKQYHKVWVFLYSLEHTLFCCHTHKIHLVADEESDVSWWWWVCC